MPTKKAVNSLSSKQSATFSGSYIYFTSASIIASLVTLQNAVTYTQDQEFWYALWTGILLYLAVFTGFAILYGVAVGLYKLLHAVAHGIERVIHYIVQLILKSIKIN